MKKMIAILLTLSMITAIAGCKKKSEETTTEEAESSTTEVSETEASSESESESETESETSATSSETEGSSETKGPSVRDLTAPKRPKDYSVSSDFKITEGDAENLQFFMISEPRVAITGDSQDQSAPAHCIYKSVDKFDFFPNTIEGYEQLWNSVHGNGESLDSSYNDAFDTQRPIFIKNSESGTLTKDYFMESRTHIFRADSKYLSYYMTQNYTDSAVDNGSIKTFNYRSSDGCPLNINDVVTNRAGFADFIVEYVTNSDAYDYIGDSAKKIAELLKNENADVEFLLGYDAIYLVSAETNSYYADIIKIPAMYCGDYLDLSCFGATPKYYTLSSDNYSRITWDLNGDGKLEEIYPEFEKDEYGNIINMNLVLDSTSKTPVPSNDIGEVDGGLYFVGMKLMKTDSGFYAYIELSPEEADSYVYVFNFNGSAFTYVNYFIGNLGNESCYDPDNFKVSHLTDLFGTGMVSYNCSVISHGGLPIVVDAFGSKFGIGFAKVDISCNEIDKEGHQIGTYTIKAGSACYCTGLDLEGKRIRLMVLGEDETKNTEVELLASNEGNHLVIGAQDQNEAFYGLRYAG
ncbi:MAG: hypothetical protein IK106_02460 [Clostridiales bacterium]|nr:hypothetical protein [Clostridiales bacterium]